MEQNTQDYTDDSVETGESSADMWTADDPGNVAEVFMDSSDIYPKILSKEFVTSGDLEVNTENSISEKKDCLDTCEFGVISDLDKDIINEELIADESNEFWEDDRRLDMPPSQSTPVRNKKVKNHRDDQSLLGNSTNHMLSRTQDDSFNELSFSDELSTTTADGIERTMDSSLSEIEGDSILQHHVNVSRISSHISMDYDYEWETPGIMKEIAEAAEESTPSGRDRIILHELSFDEGGKVARPELYGPVFLAVTEDNDDEELANMRKTHKTQSLEDLLEIVSHEDEDIPKRNAKTPPPRLTRAKLLTPPLEESDDLKFTDENISRDGESLEKGQMASQNRISTQPPRRARKLPAVPLISKKESEEAKLTSQESEEKDTPPEMEGSTLGQNSCVVEEEEDEEESRAGRWYTVVVNSRNKVLDLDKIEPYMKVLSHGGYCNDGRSVIVTFMACYLPDRHIKDYEYIMEQLFFYVVSTVDLLATREDYVLVYFNGGAKQSAPGLNWLRRYYTQVDKSLKKSLDSLYIVHPDLWLKTMVRLFKPFISSSFTQRLHMVKTVRDLSQHIPTEYIFIPDEVMCSDPDYLRYHGR